MTKAEIQLVRSLADKRARIEQGLFVAEGEKLIGEIRSSKLRVKKIFALEGLFAGDEVEVVTPKEMERLSLLKTPSKAVALVEIPRYKLRTSDLEDKLILALDEVQNPGNLGTIIRLADWFGITDIVCSADSADCFNPKVVQATMVRFCASRCTMSIWRPSSRRLWRIISPAMAPSWRAKTSTRHPSPRVASSSWATRGVASRSVVRAMSHTRFSSPPTRPIARQASR